MRTGEAAEHGGRGACAPVAAALLAVLALALLGAGPAGAATATVTFDDLPAGTAVATQYTGRGVGFAGPPADGWFPVVRSAPGAAASGDRVADVGTCTSANCEFSTPSSTGRLSSSASRVSVAVGLLGADVPPLSAQVTLRALDAQGAILASDSATVVERAAFTHVLTVSTPSPQIAAFQVVGSQGFAGVAIDDLAIVTPGSPQPPDFSLVVGPDPVSVPEQDAADVPVTVSRTNGSTGDITLSAAGLPEGLAATFSPNPIAGTSTQATMHLEARPGAPTTAQYTDATITATPSPTAGPAPRTATKTVRVVGNCVKIVRAGFIDARTLGTGCMRSQGPDVVVATGQPIRLNGLLLEPQDQPGRIIINTRERTVSSDGGDVRVSPADHSRIRLFNDAIDWNLGGADQGPRQVIDSGAWLQVGAGGEEPLVDLFAFFRVERVRVSLTAAGKAQVLPTLAFGFWPFDYLGKKTAITTGFSTDNDHGSSLDGLGFSVDDTTVLGLGIKNVNLLYQAGGRLEGGATVTLPLAKPYELRAGLGLRAGAFDHLNAALSAINAPVSPGVFLQRIAFDAKTGPLSLQGSAAFSAGPRVLGVQPITANGIFTVILADPWVVELQGTANILQRYFGDRFQLANAYLRYTSTGLFEFGGGENWDLKVAYANGGISGFVDGLRAFDVEGRQRVCISIPFAPDPCAGAAVLASNLGIAACLDATVLQAGVGYRWGGDFDLLWGSCDLGAYRPVAGSARVAAADGARRVTLPRGLPRVGFAVDGVSTAPDVTLTGPRGERLTVTAADPRVAQGRLSAVRGAGTTTYLSIAAPEAGTWTIAPAGVEPIRAVRRANGLPRPAVRASVSGSGRRRTLHWRLRPIPGQRVQLVESGRLVKHVLLTTSAASGSRAFAPAEGPAGRRRIVAMVQQQGRPRAVLNAGTYAAPGPERPARARAARIVRRAGGLQVRWRTSTPRFRYAVALRLGDGRALVRIAPAGRSSVSVPGLPAAYGASASIVGLTRAFAKGPAATTTLAGAPPRPAPGRWRTTATFGFSKAGQFTVARGAVRALRLTPGPNADAGCGTAPFLVTAPRRLVRSTRDGLAVLAAGRSSRGAPAAARVTVAQGRRRIRGTLALEFPDARRASAELQIPGCRIYAEARR